MLGNVLWFGLAVGMIIQGVYSIRHPDRPPIGWKWGGVPEPRVMRRIGLLLLAFGIAVGLIGIIGVASRLW